MARHKTLVPTSSKPAASPHQAERTIKSKGPNRFGSVSACGLRGDNVVGLAEVVAVTVMMHLSLQQGLLD